MSPVPYTSITRWNRLRSPLLRNLTQETVMRAVLPLRSAIANSVRSSEVHGLRTAVRRTSPHVKRRQPRSRWGRNRFTCRILRRRHALSAFPFRAERFAAPLRALKVFTLTGEAPAPPARAPPVSAAPAPPANPPPPIFMIAASPAATAFPPPPSSIRIRWPFLVIRIPVRLEQAADNSRRPLFVVRLRTHGP